MRITDLHIFNLFKMRSLLLSFQVFGLLLEIFMVPLCGEEYVSWRIPWDDSAPTVTDLSALNGGSITEEGRISVREGHFYDQTGKRIRFLGVNLVWSACFPDKEDALIIAKRLRKLGVNLIRMHAMDAYVAPRGIWDASDPYRRHLDGTQLDRLDYFIAQLKREGIYIDINLLVNRKPWEFDSDVSARGVSAKAGEGSLYFYPPYRELQKEYARDLLTRKNPYTGFTYANDPSIAIVELINEKSLVMVNTGDILRTMPEPLQASLDSQWNAFLKEKYQSTTELEKAWYAEINRTPLGPNILKNAQFENGDQYWINQILSSKVKAGLSIIQQDASESKIPGNILIMDLGGNTTSQASDIQLHQTGIDLPSKTICTLTFYAKSERPRSISVQLMQDRAPWMTVAPTQTIAVTSDWQLYTLLFQVGETLPKHSRLTFQLGGTHENIYLADIKLNVGAYRALPKGQSLEKANVAFPANSNLPEGRDAIEWMSRIEADYMEDMSRFLKEVLGVKAPIIGSQAFMGGLTGVWRESRMDALDMHGYWFHPAYAIKGDSNSGIIKTRETPIVTQLHGIDGQPNKSTIFHFAAHRLKGKPYIISEFNTCVPVESRMEGLPIMAAYAAQQDWDALIIFDYTMDRERFRSDEAPTRFFSIHKDPAAIAMMPFVAHLIRRGDVAPPKAEMILKIPVSEYSKLVPNYANTWGGMTSLWYSQSLKTTTLHQRRISVEFVKNGPLRVDELGAVDRKPSSLYWRSSGINDALFTVDAPASKAIVYRYPQDRASRVDLSGFSVEFGDSLHQFAVASVTSMTDAPTNEAPRLLLTLGGTLRNDGFKWTVDDGIKEWGHAPVLIEAVPAKVRLARKNAASKIYGLDETGSRLYEIPSVWKDGILSFTVNDPLKSLWFEIANP